jgi:Flp pilus assembly protein TadG
MKNNLPTPSSSKPERAQSLVEFALTLLLILMILTGAIELSLALFEYVTIRDAAQEGAIFASVNPMDTNAIKARVIDAANDGVDLSTASTAISITSNGATATGKTFCEGATTAGIPLTITVRISRPHQLIMPLVGTFIGQQINMTASATNTILTPACSP